MTRGAAGANTGRIENKQGDAEEGQHEFALADHPLLAGCSCKTITTHQIARCRLVSERDRLWDCAALGRIAQDCGISRTGAPHFASRASPPARTAPSRTDAHIP